MDLNYFRPAGRSRGIAVAAVIAFLVSIQGAAAGPAVYGMAGGNRNVSAPPVDITPQVKNIIQGVAGLERPAANRLIVHQDKPKAVIDWESFNIGKDAWTHFDQQGNSDWTALNRIYDRSPSMIFGKLTADGKVFLVNQNGVLFGPDSRVNVQALTASTLNIKNDDFLNGQLKFKAENYVQPTEPVDDRAAVVNEGHIEAAALGSVILAGQRVENHGSISAPVGQVALAAGDEVAISANESGGLNVAHRSSPGAPGIALNAETGRISSETGWVGMFGRVVNQAGLVRSVSALKRNGKIVLAASEKTATAPKSVTESPISDSDETAHESFEFKGGEVTLSGPRVEHGGVINAPSGTVKLNAEERVYLDKGSRIDVSGSWVELPAQAGVVDAQLNSVQMRDAHVQKGGVLAGQSITVNSLYGSTIGDIQGNLNSREKSAAERSTAGGVIQLSAPQGDIILRDAAVLDFSGGGIDYQPGWASITKLLSGTRIYDISSAPESLQYDRVLSRQKKVNERFGMVKAYEGLYAGGAVPLMDYIPGRIQGADAGQLTLIAKSFALDGQILAGVRAGAMQTDAEKSPKTSGRSVPKGGTLAIGIAPAGSSASRDLITEDVVFTALVPVLPALFGPEDPFPHSGRPAGTGGMVQSSQLAAEKLSTSGIQSISVYSNTKVTIDESALIALPPGGSFAVTARAIEHRGSIRAAAGDISLSIDDNLTTFERLQDDFNPRFVPMMERIYLAPGARISAAGERLDQSAFGTAVNGVTIFGRTAGGAVSLADKIDSLGGSVIVRSGARIDVDGGYRIDSRGKVSGGHAGSIEIQGATVVNEGTLTGLALEGSQGGRLMLHAGEIRVGKQRSQLPQGFGFETVIGAAQKGRLNLTPEDLTDSGFSRIELKAVNDLSVQSGVTLMPSLAQSAAPRLKNGVVSPGGAILRMDPERAGASSVSLTAGQLLVGLPLEAVPNLEAILRIEDRARLQATPGGSIQLKGPRVEMNGILEAPSGKIGVAASQADLQVGRGARLLAGGYIRPLPPAGLQMPAGAMPNAGGQVSLAAGNGNLIIESGAVVDVSGAPATDYVIQRSGGGFDTVTLGGDAGEVELSYSGNLWLEGRLLGEAGAAGARGGAISIRRTNSSEALTLSAADLTRYQGQGFNALTFKSLKGVRFLGDMNIEVARSLTLDAPEISGMGSDAIRIQAPWIKLANSSEAYGNIPVQAGPGRAGLDLSAGWMDVEGSLAISGFGAIRLSAERDMTLADRRYKIGDAPKWEGRLQTATADLVLAADRIYPTTLSDFGIVSDGSVHLLSSVAAVQGPVFSAGGRVRIEAPRIEHRGRLLAPIGEIHLLGKGPEARVYLSENSLTSTAGSSSSVYGTLDDAFWSIPDKGANTTTEVNAAPAKNIQISAAEVILRDGAEIDVSGGGSVFAYQPQAGVEGSENPLRKGGRFVILPSDAAQRPGDAVFLEGGFGLAAGTYSILPEQFAFVPGAYVLSDLGLMTREGAARTAEGYGIVSGFRTFFGSGQPAAMRRYSLRPAAEVLKEGYFNLRRFEAGAGGSVLIGGDSVVLDASVRASALSGFEPGSLALVGREMIVASHAAPLPGDFGIGSSLPAALRGKLSVEAVTLSASGFKSIELGDGATTERIRIQEGVELAVPSVRMAARDLILIEPNARVHATGESGAIVLAAPDIRLGADAMLHARTHIGFDSVRLDLQGEITVDEGSLGLAGSRIVFAPQGYAGTTSDGLYVTESLWSKFNRIKQITLSGAADVTFLGGFQLNVPEQLRFETPRIAVVGPAGTSVGMSSQKIVITNSGAPSDDTALADTAMLELNASEIFLGRGATGFDGLGRVALNAEKDIHLIGQGAVSAGGDLLLRAARLAPESARTSDDRYEAPRFRLEAAEGTFRLDRSAGESGSSATPGATIEIAARRIEQAGAIEAPSGVVRYRSTGEAAAGGIHLMAGSAIRAGGTESAPGGTIDLQSASTAIRLEPGALLDVSAGAQGDAGSMAFKAPAAEIALDGELRGAAAGFGRGAGFSMDISGLNTLSGLLAKLEAGGFSGAVDIRSRTGDLTIDSGIIARAGALQIAADQGSISLLGSIDASGAMRGGEVRLFAGRDLSLGAGSAILAKGLADGAEGGRVYLGAVAGEVRSAPGASIDVSGANPAMGGTVSIRAPRSGNDIAVRLGGPIRGASRISAEAVRVYDHSGETVTAADAGIWRQDAGDFMQNSEAIRSRLMEGLSLEPGVAFHLLPGIEVRSAASLTIAEDIDTTAWRFGTDPGALTFRSAGDLTLSASLADHPTDAVTLATARPERLNSWAFTLAAGADLLAADPLATLDGTGNLRIEDGRQVYTETATLFFASGRNTWIGSGAINDYVIEPELRYNLASYDGNIRGKVGGHLEIAGGAIQSGTGDICISMNGDLVLSPSLGRVGTIRTTGRASTNEVLNAKIGNISEDDLSTFYWAYTGGGDIYLQLNGSVVAKFSPKAWDLDYSLGSEKIWGASYGSTGVGGALPTEGIAAMAGGSVSITAGGDVTSQIGTFGAGDLSVLSHGDVDGRLLLRQGLGKIIAMGSVGRRIADIPIEMFAGSFSVAAQGDIVLGAILNPSIARNGFTGGWNLLYAGDTAVRLRSFQGDVSLSGVSRFYAENTDRSRILPPVLEVDAGRDVQLANSFALAPSSSGNLKLAAGRDVDGQYLFRDEAELQIRRSSLLLSDVDPRAVFGEHSGEVDALGQAVNHTQLIFNRFEHAASPLHAGDLAPVSITAGTDIANVDLFLSKRAEIAAGRDIKDIYYLGQNLSPADVTLFRAGRDIRFKTFSSSLNSGIEHGGPGLMVVQAMESLDLGITKGIQSIGSQYNPALGLKGSAIAALVGLAQSVDEAGMQGFFKDLRDAGAEFSRLIAAGERDDAKALAERTRREIIAPFVGDVPGGSGNLNMTSSQINTSGGVDDIYILSAGNLNVGRTTFFTDEQQRQGTGIFTAAGGSIDIYAGGDVNVNESRVMTFRGGDITLYSDRGNINAGRGSKTAINAEPPKRVPFQDTFIVVFSPPAVGSGIRTLTYDPDGIEGPALPPLAGDVYLFAPEGTIDAGEAGIAGRNVILGATEVLNVQNISFALGAVGVPQTGGAGPSVGALAGAGSVSETSKMASESTALKGAEERMAKFTEELNKNLVPKIIMVEVMGFEDEKGN